MLSQNLFDGDNHMDRHLATVEQAQADFARRKQQADCARANIAAWNLDRVHVGEAAICATWLRRYIAEELDA